MINALSFAAALTAFGQDISIGSWRTHYSYQSAKLLAVSSDKVFCATENGFFSRELSTGTTRKLSKLDGLSGSSISALAYHPAQNILAIGYASGLIDLVFEEEIKTIREVADTNLEGDKEIYQIAFSDEEVFLATGLGVLVIDPFDGSIVENFVQIGENGDEEVVFEIAYYKELLYIKTADGVQYGSRSANLLDFNNWVRFDDTASLSGLTVVNDALFAVNDDSLYQLVDGNWQNTEASLPLGGTDLFASGNALYTASGGDIFLWDGGHFNLETSTSAIQVRALTVHNGAFILADEFIGLIDESGAQLNPDGPYSDDFSKIKVVDGECYGFHAPSPSSYNGTQRVASYSHFEEAEWNINTIDGFGNVCDAAFFNGALFFASIGDGLYYTPTEEILKDIPLSSTALDTIIPCLTAKNETLWLTSFDNNNPLHTLNGAFADETAWISYTSDLLGSDKFTSIDVSASSIAWLGQPLGTITILNPFESEVDLLSTADGLPDFFTDVEISVEDDVWVATTDGPATFIGASAVFASTEAILPTYENRTLFEDENVSAVATDGGNRVWFATDRGLWLFDETISEQFHLFTSDNSPLPSDVILDLAYNPSNGELFVLTDKGLLSYRSDSSIGSSSHRDVSVFPNPVRPGYSGVVGLKGLAANASVKITDAYGNLVQEIQAYGSTASWDLRNLFGHKVKTGVYLFFSATSDGEETYIGKIAVVQ